MPQLHFQLLFSAIYPSEGWSQFSQNSSYKRILNFQIELQQKKMCLHIHFLVLVFQCKYWHQIFIKIILYD